MSEATNTEFVIITVDGRELQAPKGAMLIEVTDKVDIRHAFKHARAWSMVPATRQLSYESANERK